MLKARTSYCHNDSFYCSTWNMLPTSESWQRCHMNMGENMRFYIYLLFWFTDIKPYIVFYKVQSWNGVPSSCWKERLPWRSFYSCYLFYSLKHKNLKWFPTFMFRVSILLLYVREQELCASSSATTIMINGAEVMMTSGKNVFCRQKRISNCIFCIL